MGGMNEVAGEVTVWHDEADRLAVWGCLDPSDACMCRECVLPNDTDPTARPDATWGNK